MPLPTRRNAKRFLEALQPKMAIFVKYEFWPAYLKELNKRQIPTYSICSIFRPTQRFFRWYGGSSLKLLKLFTHLYVQDEDSRRLLAEHGVHQATVAGDTRFDRVKQITDERVNGLTDERLAPIEQFVEGAERVLVAGSTWEQDEVLLKQYIDAALNDASPNDIKLILVPHEIDEEHLHFIFNLFQGRFVRGRVCCTPM